MDQYLQIGKIVNTHGVRGAVMIEAWCDTPEVLTQIPVLFFLQDNVFQPIRVLQASVHKNRVLATLEGVQDMDAALRLKNRIVYADRDQIPRGEGELFIVDLIGLPVIDARSGRKYGVLTDVQQGASSDIYEIDTGKETVLMPAVKEYVARIALQEAIYITPIPGFFEE